MLLGVIADDFTGASDIANTIARGVPPSGGLSVAQFMGIPRAPAPAGIDAGVVALKSRSIAAAEAVEQSLAALRWLEGQGCRQFVFKICSTFDSTPDGNIGPVAEALARALGSRTVIVCPAFPRAGRTVYQGHLFVADRLLSESGMQNHPLNPMADPDIRRWLALQSEGDVGHLPLATIARGATTITAALATAEAMGQTLIIADAITDENLITLGEAAASAKLLTGGSGIALGLPGNFIGAGRARKRQTPAIAMRGPAAILVGSCSVQTRAQLTHFEKRFPTVRIDAEAVLEGTTTAEDLFATMMAKGSDLPLAYSSASPEDIVRLQGRYGREALAETLDALFAEMARLLVAGGVERLIVAGGETSGAVVTALGGNYLVVGEEIAPGVPALLMDGERPLALALKSGNFGGLDFFVEAAERLAGR